MSKFNQDVPYSWEEEMNEAADRLMEERHESVPPMEILQKDADEIDETLAKVTPGSSTQDDIIHLIGEQSPAPGKKPEVVSIAHKKIRPLQRQSRPVKPKEVEAEPEIVQDPEKTPTLRLKEKPEQKDSTEESYQESFASQQESAALREQMESLDRRMINLERQIEAILAERSNLPTHINNLKIDLNKQLTIMNERLHTAMEKDIKPSDLEATHTIVQGMTLESAGVLSTIAEETAAEPTSVSQIASSTPIGSKKKKVKLIA